MFFVTSALEVCVVLYVCSHSSLSCLCPDLSPSHQSGMISFARAKQRLILDIDASVFVLLSSFCSDAEVSGTEGIQTLST